MTEEHSSTPKLHVTASRVHQNDYQFYSAIVPDPVHPVRVVADLPLVARLRRTDPAANVPERAQGGGVVRQTCEVDAVALHRAPHPREQAVATAGFAVTGLVASDGLLGASGHQQAEMAEPESAQAETALVAMGPVEKELLADWQLARESTYRDLYAALGKLDPTIPDLLQGAWTEVYRPGPARVTKLANCVVEALDRALRAGAPDEDLQAWAYLTGQQSNSLQVNGRWTRATRIRYVLRNASYSPRLTEQQAVSLVASQSELGHRLQAVKHASIGDVEATKVHLISAEAILSQLFSAGSVSH